jgi:hypothetical protein
MFRAWALVAGTSIRPQRRLGILSQLRKFLAGGTAADRPAPSHEAAGTDCTAAAPQATIDFFVGVAPSYKEPETICLRPFFVLVKGIARPGIFLSVVASGLDQALFNHFFIAEPQVWNIGRAEAKDVLEGPADFTATEIHANAVQKIEQRLGAFRQKWLRPCANAIETVVGQDIDRMRPATMADDVKKRPRLGLGTGDIWR